MKLHNRIFSTLLAVILMLGSLSCLTVGASAASSSTAGTVDIEQVYLKTVYNTPEERVFGTEDKPSYMKLVSERGNYQLYVDTISGEIAMVDTVTGQILLSNPYDVASSKGSTSTKQEALSQLMVQYLDNNKTKYMNSFEDAAMREQITVLNIRNGVRVEYTIGVEETRKLVPRSISVENFEKFIKAPLQAAVDDGLLDIFYPKTKVWDLYILRDLDAMGSERAKATLIATYPVCEYMDIYTLDTTLKASDINLCESYIKAYCTEYTFEQMDADHEETQYIETTQKSPVFKMALEYSLDEDGLSVRLPCNGLRYDMSTYTLENLSILPYMGAGNNATPGYNFFPDGSGALFDFEQLNVNLPTQIRGKVYGLDYAYHQISGSTQTATIYYPVYGSVSTEVYYNFSYTAPDSKGNMVPQSLTVSKSVMTVEKIEQFVEDLDGVLTSSIEPVSYDRGYVAVIEEGDSFAEIETYHAGALSNYNTLINYFNPKPKDSYDISGAISVSGSGTQTVVSERKYTGSLTIRYMMLNDPGLGEEQRALDSTYTYYEASWLGMAEAYRDYLVSKDVLTELKDTEENIPLYIEMFGAMETQQTIMTIPVNVMTPLTTFDNVYDVYDELSKQGVKNINFKMTGFANGGMFATVPASLKWEKAVGGKNGFKELIEEAAKINAKETEHIGLYPDFDFAYIQKNELFDSTILKDDAIKTIDNRYTSYREYSATYQTYVSFYQLAVSPSRYSKFYNKLLGNYEQYGLKSMSVASLGTALNSDFDEDDPYNREDSKDFTVQAFEDLQSAGYSLMTAGANAYTWGYVDHIINVKLDSSRFVKSSASVPFIGVVLHGYVQFAGTPMNEEGDTDYAILRALENGAGLYFILSYQNTNELKENYYLSQYYSVRYDIWKEDVISYYNQLNDLLKDVQDKLIIDHEFLNHDPENGIYAERILDLDELQAEIAAELKAAEEAAKQEMEDIETSKALEVADAWKLAENAYSDLEELIESMKATNEEIAENYSALKGLLKSLSDYATSTLLPNITTGDPDLDDNIDEFSVLHSSMKTTVVNIIKNFNDLESQRTQANQIITDLQKAKDVVMNSNALKDENVKEQMAYQIDAYKAEAETLLPAVTEQSEWAEKNGMLKDAILENTVKTVNEALTPSGQLALDPQNVEKIRAIVKDYMLTADDIEEEASLGNETDKNTEEDTDNGSTHHVVDNNQVVLVTYGDRDAATYEKTPHKSFILNYNNFAVRVTYDEKVYTIPAGGYVVIYHSEEEA